MFRHDVVNYTYLEESAFNAKADALQMWKTHTRLHLDLQAHAFEKCHTGPLNAAEHTYSKRPATLWMGDAHNAFPRHVTCVSMEYRTLMTKRPPHPAQKK